MDETLRLVVLLTGAAPAPVEAEHGDFMQMFATPLAAAAGTVQLEAIEMGGAAEHDALDDLSRFDGVLMSGSASMVAEDAGWMRRATRTVRALLAGETPFLGVCFGHQILGLAVGAEVGPNPRGREMGTVRVSRTNPDDPLMAGLSSQFGANVSHSDVIIDARGHLEVVAEAPHDPHHVVRAGPAAWGVQYHPEFTGSVMRSYLHQRQESLDAARGAGTTASRLASVETAEQAQRTLSHFCDLIRGLRDGR